MAGPIDPAKFPNLATTAFEDLPPEVRDAVTVGLFTPKVMEMFQEFEKEEKKRQQRNKN